MPINDYKITPVDHIPQAPVNILGEAIKEFLNSGYDKSASLYGVGKLSLVVR